MFTISQIKAAHSKVKSGADFPRYIQDLKALGVNRYDHFVSDGHTVYFSKTGEIENSGPQYPVGKVASAGSVEDLKDALAAHQKGKTDYLTFCRQSGEAGVEKWTVDISKMSCTYLDLEGKEMVNEIIPDLK